MTRRTWLVVASRQARAARPDGAGDRVLVYSPRTSHPDGEPLRAITVAGEITGPDAEQSPVIPDGFSRAADLHEVGPVPLASIRDHLPVSRLRFGFLELPAPDADAIWEVIGMD